MIKQHERRGRSSLEENIRCSWKTAQRGVSQTSFRTDRLWLPRTGRCKGKHISYSCVDLLVFVPLVTLPFQMSEELIWADPEHPEHPEHHPPGRAGSRRGAGTEQERRWEVM